MLLRGRDCISIKPAPKCYLAFASDSLATTVASKKILPQATVETLKVLDLALCFKTFCDNPNAQFPRQFHNMRHVCQWHG